MNFVATGEHVWFKPFVTGTTTTQEDRIGIKSNQEDFSVLLQSKTKKPLFFPLR